MAKGERERGRERDRGRKKRKGKERKQHKSKVLLDKSALLVLGSFLCSAGVSLILPRRSLETSARRATVSLLRAVQGFARRAGNECAERRAELSLFLVFLHERRHRRHAIVRERCVKIFSSSDSIISTDPSRHPAILAVQFQGSEAKVARAGRDLFIPCKIARLFISCVHARCRCR